MGSKGIVKSRGMGRSWMGSSRMWEQWDGGSNRVRSSRMVESTGMGRSRMGSSGMGKSWMGRSTGMESSRMWEHHWNSFGRGSIQQQGAGVQHVLSSPALSCPILEVTVPPGWLQAQQKWGKGHGVLLVWLLLWANGAHLQASGCRVGFRGWSVPELLPPHPRSSRGSLSWQILTWLVPAGQVQ